MQKLFKAFSTSFTFAMAITFIFRLSHFNFSEKQYGPPGLDFNEINIKGIKNYLDQGFNDKEVVYFKKGKLIKSRLTTSYYPDSPQSTITYYFNAESIYKRLLNKILGRGNQYDDIKHIDLRNIFSGLNDS